MAEQNIPVQPRLKIPDQPDMLGDGMHVAPCPLHRMTGFQPSSSGQGQKRIDSIAAVLRDMPEIEPVAPALGHLKRLARLPF